MTTRMMFAALLGLQLAACAPSGDGGGGSAAQIFTENQQPPATGEPEAGPGDVGAGTGGGEAPVPPPVDDGRLKLKQPGQVRVMVGSTRDLRSFVLNGERAGYVIVKGSELVWWVDLDLPILNFHSAGDVEVEVRDTERSVRLKIKVVLDTISPPGVGDGDGEPVPIGPPIPL